MEMIKGDKVVEEYIPDYSEKHRPNKTYICNIINTVHKNSIKKWVKDVKAKNLEEK